MAKLMEFKENLKPFEKIEQEISFENEKQQVYFELQKGSPKRLVSFFDEENNEIMSRELPESAFIKPYANKAKIFIVNQTEKEMKVEFKIVAGVRVL